MNEWLEDKADTVTRWETDTRCNMDYSVELEKVKQGLEQIRNCYFQIYRKQSTEKQ